MRVIFCKTFNYPILPVSLRFDDMSIYWLYFLTFFYVEGGYLDKLPLKNKDIKTIYLFRYYVSQFPYHLYNFFQYIDIKNIFFKPTFNAYKHNYKFFLIYSKKLKFLNTFVKGDLWFFKFILLKSIITSEMTMNFFWLNFLQRDVNKNNIKNTLFKDFFITLTRLFAKHNKLRSVKTYPYINIQMITNFFYFKKKPLKKKRNFFVKEDLYWIEYFRAKKEYYFYKNYFIYKKIWLHYFLNIYEMHFLFEFLTFKNNAIINFKGFKNLTFLKNYPVKINTEFKNFFKNFWPTRYAHSTFTKFIDLTQNKTTTIFFLRKVKIFSKGRYSRNRQIYRTGVYMCLWINVIFVYFYFFSFYRLAFNFGFLWYGIGLFILSMVFGRAARYRLYNYANFYNELKSFLNWMVFFSSDLYSFFFKKILNLLFK